METMKIYDFNVDHSNQQDQKLLYEFGSEMKWGRKSDKDKSLKKLLKSPAIMASRNSAVSLSSDLDELQID